MDLEARFIRYRLMATRASRPLRGSSPKQESIVFNDIETAPQASVENAMTRRMIERSPLCFMRLDSRFHALDVNQSFCRMLHRSSEEIVGKTVWQVLDCLPRQTVEMAIRNGVAHTLENCAISR